MWPPLTSDVAVDATLLTTRALLNGMDAASSRALQDKAQSIAAQLRLLSGPGARERRAELLLALASTVRMAPAAACSDARS